jgi:hypothetical protein
MKKIRHLREIVAREELRACGTPDLVVIEGPNKSVICARPNSLVAAGNYSLNSSTLTIVSEKSCVDS